MAGVLVLNSGDWYVSSGGFRAMVDGVSRYLAVGQTALAVKGAFAVAVESNLLFVDVTNSFSDNMLGEFKRALELHICEATATDANSLELPDFHRGYLERLNELNQRVDESLAMARVNGS